MLNQNNVDINKYFRCFIAGNLHIKLLVILLCSAAQIKCQYTVAWKNINGGFADENNLKLVKTTIDGWSNHMAITTNVLPDGEDGFFSFYFAGDVAFKAGIIESNSSCVDYTCFAHGVIYDGNENGDLYLVESGIVKDTLHGAVTTMNEVRVFINEGLCSSFIRINEVLFDTAASQCSNYRLFAQLKYQGSSIEELQCSHSAQSVENDIWWNNYSNAYTKMNGSRIYTKDSDSSTAAISNLFHSREANTLKYFLENDSSPFEIGVLNENDELFSARHNMAIKYDGELKQAEIFVDDLLQNTIDSLEQNTLFEIEVTISAIYFRINGNNAYVHSDHSIEFYHFFVFTPPGIDGEMKRFKKSRHLNFPVEFEQDEYLFQNFRTKDLCVKQTLEEPPYSVLSKNVLPQNTDGFLRYRHNSMHDNIVFGLYEQNNSEHSEWAVAVEVSHFDVNVYSYGELLFYTELNDDEELDFYIDGDEGHFNILFEGIAMLDAPVDVNVGNPLHVITSFLDDAACLTGLSASFPADYHCFISDEKPYDNTKSGGITFDGIQFNSNDKIVIFEVDQDYILSREQFDSLSNAYQIYGDSILGVGINPFDDLNYGDFLSYYSGEIHFPKFGNNHLKIYDTNHVLIDEINFKPRSVTLLDSVQGVDVEHQSLVKTGSTGWGAGHVTLANALYPNVYGGFFFDIPSSGEFVVGLRNQNNIAGTGIAGINYGVYANNGIVKVIKDGTLEESNFEFHDFDSWEINRLENDEVEILRNGVRIFSEVGDSEDWLRCDVKIHDEGGRIGTPKSLAPSWPVFQWIEEPEHCGVITEYNLELADFAENNPHYFTASSSSYSYEYQMKDIFSSQIVAQNSIPVFSNLPKGVYLLSITQNPGTSSEMLLTEEVVAIGHKAAWNQTNNSISFGDFNNSIRNTNTGDPISAIWNSDATTSNKLLADEDGWFSFKLPKIGSIYPIPSHSLGLSPLMSQGFAGSGTMLPPFQTSTIPTEFNRAPAQNELLLSSSQGNEFVGVKYNSMLIAPRILSSTLIWEDLIEFKSSAESIIDMVANSVPSQPGPYDQFTVRRAGNGAEIYINGTIVLLITGSTPSGTGQSAAHNNENANIEFNQAKIQPAHYHIPNHGFNEVVTSFPCATPTYHHLYPTMKDNYYHTLDNYLFFKLDGRYNSGNINFNVYADGDPGANQIVNISPLVKHFGDNRFEFNANTLPEGFYVLEVTNEKSEVKKLRFYNKY